MAVFLAMQPTGVEAIHPLDNWGMDVSPSAFWWALLAVASFATIITLRSPILSIVALLIGIYALCVAYHHVEVAKDDYIARQTRSPGETMIHKPGSDSYSSWPTGGE